MLSIAERLAIRFITNGQADISVLFMEQCKQLSGAASTKRALRDISMEYFFERGHVLIQYRRKSKGKHIIPLLIRDFQMWFQKELKVSAYRMQKRTRAEQELIRYMSPITQHPEAKELLEQIIDHPHSRARLGDLKIKKPEELLK